MARIVITEFMDEPSVERLSSIHDVTYQPDLADRQSELMGVVRSAEAVIVRNRTQVTEEVLQAAPMLRVVGRLGVGLDNIDIRACRARGVVVRAATGANAVAVAEYVIGALLSLVRGAFAGSHRILAGEWPRLDMRGGELAGRRLGLVGYGSIARVVGQRAAGLGMTVAAYDPHLAEGFDWSPAEPLPLDRLLSSSDAVSVHVPLVPETAHLIDAAALARMPTGSILINTARGGVVDEAALADSLASGHLGGAALDVFEHEPPNPEDLARFAGLNNLILTPHIAGVTDESTERVSRVVADAVLEELSDA